MLHTVNKSPTERNTLDSCLGHALKGHALLLIEDGVYAVRKDTAAANRIKSRLGEIAVYALGPDLAARGIAQTEILDGVTVVDYGGFVDLAVDKGPVHSWL